MPCTASYRSPSLMGVKRGRTFIRKNKRIKTMPILMMALGSFSVFLNSIVAPLFSYEVPCHQCQLDGAHHHHHREQIPTHRACREVPVGRHQHGSPCSGESGDARRSLTMAKEPLIDLGAEYRNLHFFLSRLKISSVLLPKTRAKVIASSRLGT